MPMWEARCAQIHGERLAELSGDLDSIAVRLGKLKALIHVIERGERLATTRLRGSYEPNDEPLSSRELCHP
jgi:hypothetical protein